MARLEPANQPLRLGPRLQPGNERPAPAPEPDTTRVAPVDDAVLREAEADAL